MSPLELKAYWIGVDEAKQRGNVPACKSPEMNRLMGEVKNNLLPLIKAYNFGVHDETNRQAYAAIGIEKRLKYMREEERP